MYKRFTTNLVSVTHKRPIFFEDVRDGLGDLIGIRVYQKCDNGYSYLDGIDTIFPNYSSAKKYLISSGKALEQSDE